MNAVFQLNPRPEPTLEDLAIEWLAAKAAEAKAIERRCTIDAAIASRMGGADEGTRTEKFAKVKVSTTYKVDRKVNSEELSLAWAGLPAKAQSAFRWKADIDIKAMRAAQEMAPDVYEVIAHYVTAKPARPSVKVEEI